MTEINPGDIFEFDYPFVLKDYTYWDEDGPCHTKTWTPGARFEDNLPEDFEVVADGIGRQILTVVSVHKPGHYPPRVFYTRQWKPPEGRQFGKKALLVKSLTAFKKLTRGYRYPFAIRGSGHD